MLGCDFFFFLAGKRFFDYLDQNAINVMVAHLNKSVVDSMDIVSNNGTDLIMNGSVYVVCEAPNTTEDHQGLTGGTFFV